MAAVTDLVRDWGGDHSGEHGEGLARTQWNERLFGTELYNELREIKAAFDPTNLLNPGKVVDGPAHASRTMLASAPTTGAHVAGRRPFRLRGLRRLRAVRRALLRQRVLPEDGRRDVSACGGDRA